MTCSRCEAQLTEGSWIRSVFTGNRYCLDFAACDSRAARKGLLPTRRAA